MKIKSHINLNLNWKQEKKMYFFVANTEYDVPKDVGDYLIQNYNGKFELVKIEVAQIIAQLRQKFKPEDVKYKENLKPRISNKQPTWTVGIVNYKSVSFVEHQLKTLYGFNKAKFKLIIVDNSVPSEYNQLEMVCKKYPNITLIKHKPKETPTSNQHSEGLEVIFKLVDTDYLLIQDPDFFWTQKEYLKTLQDLLDEGYVCVGAPFYREGKSNDNTPALWGCAYNTKILEKGDFGSFDSEDYKEICKGLDAGKDTGWKLRVKFEEQKLPTFSFADGLGISIKNEFSRDVEHYKVTNVDGIHEYSYRGKIIAYHLNHGCHELESSIPTFEERKNAPKKTKWTEAREKYSNFFYGLIDKEEKKLRIDVHFLTKNDERMLSYFFRHYDQYATRYFAYYNIHSKDKTLEILKSKSNVTIIEDSNPKMDDRYFKEMKNQLWKKYSDTNNCDWVIICDSDEFLCNVDLIRLLNEYDEKGITFPKVKGFQMYSDEFPKDDGKSQIYSLSKKGTSAENYDKFAIMKPHIFPEYSYGCHFACPGSVNGVVKYSDDLDIKDKSQAEIKLLHYTIFGREFVKKMMDRQNELCDFNKAMGMGVYTLDPLGRFNPQREYEYVRDNCKEVI